MQRPEIQITPSLNIKDVNGKAENNIGKFLTSGSINDLVAVATPGSFPSPNQSPAMGLLTLSFHFDSTTSFDPSDLKIAAIDSVPAQAQNVTVKIKHKDQKEQTVWEDEYKGYINDIDIDFTSASGDAAGIDYSMTLQLVPLNYNFGPNKHENQFRR